MDVPYVVESRERERERESSGKESILLDTNLSLVGNLIHAITSSVHLGMSPVSLQL